MTKILLIEDDATINELIQEFLQDKGCCCTPAYYGTEGRLLVDMEKFELILLDLMIPGMSGQDLLEYIRAGLQTPVIVLSARTALEDKVELLGMGADDYLTKPFELEELWARIQVQLRRTQGIRPSGKSVLKYKDWTINLQERSFIANKLPVELTSHEMGILELLIKHPKKVFTKQEIFEVVWQQEYFIEDKTIHVHISNIRAKLKKTGTDHYIQTVWGIGFKLGE